MIDKLKFNFGFIRKLDEKYSVNENGMKMGVGVNMVYTLLGEYQPDALVDVFFAGVKDASVTDVEEYIENYAEEHGELKPLFNEVREQMGKSGMLKTTLEQFEKRMEKEKK